MTKITALTSLASLEDADLFYVVDDTAGTPTSAAVTVQRVAEHTQAHASIFVDDNATTQASSTSFADITKFDTNGETFNATADHANDKLVATKAGTYEIKYQATVSAGSSVQVKYQLAKGGTAIPGSFSRETIAAASSMSSTSGVVHLTLAVNDEITLQMAAGSGTPALTFVNLQLAFSRIK